MNNKENLFLRQEKPQFLFSISSSMMLSMICDGSLLALQLLYNTNVSKLSKYVGTWLKTRKINYCKHSPPLFPILSALCCFNPFCPFNVVGPSCGGLPRLHLSLLGRHAKIFLVHLPSFSPAIWHDVSNTSDCWFLVRTC